MTPVHGLVVRLSRRATVLTTSEGRGAATVAACSVLLSTVFVARWLSVPRFDFDTELCLLVPLSQHAPMIWVSHGMLLPALIGPLSAVFPPLTVLLALAAVAVLALLLVLSQTVRRATGSVFAACMFLCGCASALCVRAIGTTVDDNLFPLPLLAGAVACIASRRSPGRTALAGVLTGAAAAFHLPVVLAAVPMTAWVAADGRGAPGHGALAGAGRFLAGLAAGLAVCLTLGLTVRHVCGAQPTAGSTGYFANAEWFLLAKTRSAGEVVRWLGAWADWSIRFLAPLPARLFLPGPWRMWALTFSAAWALALILLPLAAVIRERQSSAGKAGGLLTSDLNHRLSLLSLATALPFVLLSAVYESDSPERLVSAMPLLACAATVAGHRLLSARLKELFSRQWAKGLAAACCVAYVALLVLGVHPQRGEQRRLLSAAARVPDTALLVSPVEHGFLASARRSGPALYLWPPGMRSGGHLNVCHGRICGYDAACQLSDDSLAAIIRDMPPGTVLVHESLREHPLLRGACPACIFVTGDTDFAPFRRLARNDAPEPNDR